MRKSERIPTPEQRAEHAQYLTLTTMRDQAAEMVRYFTAVPEVRYGDRHLDDILSEVEGVRDKLAACIADWDAMWLEREEAENIACDLARASGVKEPA